MTLRDEARSGVSVEGKTGCAAGRDGRAGVCTCSSWDEATSVHGPVWVDAEQGDGLTRPTLIPVYMPREMVDAIDAVRGMSTRSRWVRLAIVETLARQAEAAR